MTAGGLDKADVVASMFDNVTKCMQDNAASLRRLHASGALLSTAEGKAAAKRKRAATKEEKAEKRRKSARTLTSYQLFMSGEREALKHLPPKEVMTEIARRWKLLSAEAKAPFEAKAAKLKQARLAELQGASSAPPASPKAGHAGDAAEEQQQEKKKKKKKKDKKDKKAKKVD